MIKIQGFPRCLNHILHEIIKCIQIQKFKRIGYKICITRKPSAFSKLSWYMHNPPLWNGDGGGEEVEN